MGEAEAMKMELENEIRGTTIKKTTSNEEFLSPENSKEELEILQVRDKKENKLEPSIPVLPPIIKIDISDNSITKMEQVDEEIELDASLRSKAIRAIEANHINFHSGFLHKDVRARDKVREMHSFRISNFPEDCCQTGVLYKFGPFSHDVNAILDQRGMSWRMRNIKEGELMKIKIPADDLIAAKIIEKNKMENQFEVHFFIPGRGRHQQKLKRQHKTISFQTQSKEESMKWVIGIQRLVKWYARVPLHKTRKIKIVVNPHSGKKQGPLIYRKWKPMLDLAEIECDMEETKYGGHAIDMGKQYNPNLGYEAMVFVGGDGTVNEFLNGLLQRPEEEWKHITACTPISLLSAGTDNAFGKGVGLPTHAAAIYSIIKRKIRPVDVVACKPSPNHATVFACCGASYGIGADIAIESEKTRWMGVHRYSWLKLKRSVLAPKKHVCKIKYILAEGGNGPLKTFDELQDENIHDQHHVEQCSIYDSITDRNEKKWEGEGKAIHDPAAEEVYDGKWVEEHGQYITVGAANLHFEAKYTHPSDGKMDLVVVRKGNLGKTIGLGIKYLLGDPMKSPLMSYKKIIALVIEQDSKDPINFDGEVLDGPGPFRMEIVPKLFRVLSEK